jgi:hypothetical protein
VGYEVVVDYGVEQKGVYAVVEVAVHVVIGPVGVSLVPFPCPIAVVGRKATIVFDTRDEMDSLLACGTFWRIWLPLWSLVQCASVIMYFTSFNSHFIIH